MFYRLLIIILIIVSNVRVSNLLKKETDRGYDSDDYNPGGLRLSLSLGLKRIDLRQNSAAQTFISLQHLPLLNHSTHSSTLETHAKINQNLHRQ